MVNITYMICRMLSQLLVHFFKIFYLCYIKFCYIVTSEKQAAIIHIIAILKMPNIRNVIKQNNQQHMITSLNYL